MRRKSLLPLSFRDRERWVVSVPTMFDLSMKTQENQANSSQRCRMLCFVSYCPVLEGQFWSAKLHSLLYSKLL